MLKELISTVKGIYSGDNTDIDYTQVSHTLIAAIIIGMWIWKSWTLVGQLADFPPGVQLVLFAVIGAVPVSSGVNAYRAIKMQAARPQVKVETTVTTASSPDTQDDDARNAKPS